MSDREAGEGPEPAARESATVLLGRYGEELAAQHLVATGMTVLARNWRSGCSTIGRRAAPRGERHLPRRAGSRGRGLRASGTWTTGRSRAGPRRSG